MKMIRSVYIIILSMLIVMCSSWKCYAASPGMQGFQQHEFDGGSGGANKDTSLEGNAELGLPTLDNSYKPQISLGTGENRVSNIISTILSFLTIIGVCMFVVAIAVIGFDTMMGSANEKAIEVSYDAADAKTFDSMNEMLYGRRRVTETSEIVSDHGNVNKTFSAILYKLFSFHNQNLSSPDYKLHFTPPSHNQIVCFLYPCKELNSKEETLDVFIFGYNTQGIIEFMSRAKVYQNKE